MIYCSHRSVIDFHGTMLSNDSFKPTFISQYSHDKSKIQKCQKIGIPLVGFVVALRGNIPWRLQLCFALNGPLWHKAVQISEPILGIKMLICLRYMGLYFLTYCLFVYLTRIYHVHIVVLLAKWTNTSILKQNNKNSVYWLSGIHMCQNSCVFSDDTIRIAYVYGTSMRGETYPSLCIIALSVCWLPVNRYSGVAYLRIEGFLMISNFRYQTCQKHLAITLIKIVYQ